MEYESLGGIKKIAVLRALVLGDLIFVLPALQALHHTYPQAEIYFLGRPWVAEFLIDRIPGVSRIETFRAAPTGFEDLGFLIHPEDAKDFFPRMQAERLDIAISMQGGGKNSNPFIRRLQPRLAIGSREEGAIALDRWTPYDYYQHDVIRNLDLAALAGAAPLSWTPELPLLPSDLAAAAPFLEKVRRPYMVIHSGARDIRRCWSEEKFAAIGDAIKREYGMEIVLTGSEVDAEKAQQVAQHMEETSVNLSHQLSLPALCGLLANAALVISNDTGILHLGLAVGAKGVGLYWGEYASKSMPLSRNCFYPLVAWDRHCPLCGKFLDQEEVVIAEPSPCAHRVSFISSITHQQVMQAVDKMLSVH